MHFIKKKIFFALCTKTEKSMVWKCLRLIWIHFWSLNIWKIWCKNAIFGEEKFRGIEIVLCVVVVGRILLLFDRWIAIYILDSFKERKFVVLSQKTEKSSLRRRRKYQNPRLLRKNLKKKHFIWEIIQNPSFYSTQKFFFTQPNSKWSPKILFFKFHNSHKNTKMQF